MAYSQAFENISLFLCRFTHEQPAQKVQQRYSEKECYRKPKSRFAHEQTAQKAQQRYSEKEYYRKQKKGNSNPHWLLCNAQDDIGKEKQNADATKSDKSDKKMRIKHQRNGGRHDNCRQ
jgi:hypothetical protein